MGFWGSLIANWRLAVILIAAFALGLLRIRSAWLSSALEKAKAERDQLKTYKETREVIDHATDQHLGDDPAAARRWLRERGERRGDL